MKASAPWSRESWAQLLCRHSRESGNPVSFRQRVEAQRRWVPDIASRLRLQDCKRERRRRRVARAPWMARVFRDDDQNQSFPSAPRCAALLALILSMVLPMLASASGIPPTDPGNRDLGAVVELVTAGQFKA